MSDLLNYKGYSGSVAYSADDEGLVGKILHIKSTIAYFGESVSEVKAMFQQAVDEYLEMCEELELEPEKPFKGSFNVRTSPELHRQLALIATQENKTLNELVTVAIENLIIAKKQKAPKVNSTSILVDRIESLLNTFNDSPIFAKEYKLDSPRMMMEELVSISDEALTWTISSNEQYCHWGAKNGNQKIR